MAKEGNKDGLQSLWAEQFIYARLGGLCRDGWMEFCAIIIASGSI
jgi:hypothetical protein